MIELIVVVAALFVLAFALCPSISNAPLQAYMTAVGARGKDIFVAVTRANAEREALGLPSLWPRDPDPAAETNCAGAAGVAFTNSTDYFEWLIRGRGGALAERELRVTDLDYSKLAGAGVSSCPTNRHLTAKNNMWTVAANMRHDMSDLIPILVTRNIEATSFAARVTAQDHKLKSLRFDPGWQTPFRDKGFVMIRKSGAVFKARPKYMKWGVIYQNQAFDTAQTPDGRVAPPLKYLTPTRVVTPGDQAYAEGAAVAYQLAGGHRGQIKRTASNFISSGRVLVLFLPAIYLFALFVNLANRKRLGVRPLVSAPIIGYWSCHCLMASFGVAARITGDSWCACLSLVALAVGIVLALVFQRHDPETRRRQIKGLLWLLLFLFVSCSLFPAV